MAASSPALSNNSAETTATVLSGVPKIIHFATPDATTPIQNLQSKTSKTRRGQNKPTCVKCGNVARSKCPFLSCKSCCAKFQNPCTIHVARPNTASTPLTAKPSSDSSPSGNIQRIGSVRQLSGNFTQFNNVQTPTHMKKPITRKEAEVINEWRFSRMKEFRERNTEVEDEAFERYVRNAALLEEVFRVNPKRMRGSRKSPGIVDEDHCGGAVDHDGAMMMDGHEMEQMNKRLKSFGELTEKLNRARTEEDLRVCSRLMEPKETSGSFSCSESVCGLNSSFPTKPVVCSETSLEFVDQYFDSLEFVLDL